MYVNVPVIQYHTLSDFIYVQSVSSIVTVLCSGLLASVISEMLLTCAGN